MLLPQTIGHDLAGQLGLLLGPRLLHEEERLLGRREKGSLVELWVVGDDRINAPSAGSSCALDLPKEPLKGVIALVHLALGLLGQCGTGGEQGGRAARERRRVRRILRLEAAEDEVADDADQSQEHEAAEDAADRPGPR